MIKSVPQPWNCMFEIDYARTKEERKLIINCFEPDGIYYGVLEFDDETLRSLSHPIETFLWEFKSMVDHVEWKSEQLRFQDKVEKDVNNEKFQEL